MPQPLPKSLTERQMDKLLSATSRVRDRTILEVLYSTGLRVSELCSLQWTDINTAHQTLRVNNGKGGKDRIVIFNTQVTYWLAKYRTSLGGEPLADRVFPITRKTVWGIVTRCAGDAGLIGVSPHTLRHTFATHLLDGGASTPVIQALLGHADLNTTQIYTHVAMKRKLEVHRNCHPRG